MWGAKMNEKLRVKLRINCRLVLIVGFENIVGIYLQGGL